MKKAIVMLMLSLFFMAASTRTSIAQDKTEPSSQKALYKCPMHPEITSDKPADCSRCGMHLEKVEKKEKASSVKASRKLKKGAKQTTYTCPMHPEILSDTPADCPKCGMHLEKTDKK